MHLLVHSMLGLTDMGLDDIILYTSNISTLMAVIMTIICYNVDRDHIRFSKMSKKTKIVLILLTIGVVLLIVRSRRHKLV
jgi:hypothetical protein